MALVPLVRNVCAWCNMRRSLYQYQHHKQYRGHKWQFSKLDAQAEWSSLLPRGSIMAAEPKATRSVATTISWSSQRSNLDTSLKPEQARQTPLLALSKPWGQIAPNSKVLYCHQHIRSSVRMLSAATSSFPDHSDLSSTQRQHTETQPSNYRTNRSNAPEPRRGGSIHANSFKPDAADHALNQLQARVQRCLMAKYWSLSSAAVADRQDLIDSCCRLQTLQGMQWAHEILDRWCVQQQDQKRFTAQQPHQSSRHEDPEAVVASSALHNAWIPVKTLQTVLYGWAVLVGGGGNNKYKKSNSKKQGSLVNAASAVSRMDDVLRLALRQHEAATTAADATANPHDLSFNPMPTEPTLNLFFTYLTGLSFAAKSPSLSEQAPRKAEQTLQEMWQWHKHFQMLQQHKQHFEGAATAWYAHIKPNTRCYQAVIQAFANAAAHSATAGDSAIRLLRNIQSIHAQEVVLYQEQYQQPYYYNDHNHPDHSAMNRINKRQVITPDRIMYQTVLRALTRSQQHVITQSLGNKNTAQEVIRLAQAASDLLEELLTVENETNLDRAEGVAPVELDNNSSAPTGTASMSTTHQSTSSTNNRTNSISIVRPDPLLFGTTIKAWSQVAGLRRQGLSSFDAANQRRAATQQAQALLDRMLSYCCHHHDQQMHTKDTEGSDKLGDITDDEQHKSTHDGLQTLEKDLVDDSHRTSAGGRRTMDKVGISLCFNACLDAWSRSYLPEAAPQCERILHLMLTDYQDIVQADAVSFNCCLYAWSRSTLFHADAAERAEALLQRQHDLSQKQGMAQIQPDFQSYTIAILTWANSQNSGKIKKKEHGKSSSLEELDPLLPVRRAQRLLRDLVTRVANGEVAESRNASAPYTALLSAIAQIPTTTSSESGNRYDNVDSDPKHPATTRQGDDLFLGTASESGHRLLDSDWPDHDDATTGEGSDSMRLSDLYSIAVETWNELCSSGNHRGGGGKQRAREPDHHAYAAFLQCVAKHCPSNSTERRSRARALFEEACEAGQLSRLVLQALQKVAIGMPRGDDKSILYEDEWMDWFLSPCTTQSSDIPTTSNMKKRNSSPRHIPRFWYRHVPEPFRPRWHR